MPGVRTTQMSAKAWFVRKAHVGGTSSRIEARTFLPRVETRNGMPSSEPRTTAAHRASGL